MPPLRVAFDTPRVTVQAAAGDSETASRRIEGVLVPYGVEGRAADGVLYVFEAGSLEPLRGVTPFLLGHDRNRPIGVLASHQDSAAELRASFTIDATPDGDVAIAQAQSGSRASLSIGAQPTVYQLDETGDELVVRVQQAEWVDASLVTVGAFSGAEVTRVAAQAPTAGGAMPPEPTATVNGAAASHGTGATVASDTPAGAPAPPVAPAAGAELSAGHPRIETQARQPAQLTAGGWAARIVAAQRGDVEARRFIEAALTETISTDVSGLLPPTYQRTIIGAKPTPRPLFEVFRSAALPTTGLGVIKPKWTLRPDGTWAANIDADAHSTKVTIGTQTVQPDRWDWAGAISWVVVQLSDPSVIDAIYNEAIEDFHLDVETRIAALLAAAATDASTTLGAAVAKFFATNSRTPEVILCAPDVWGKLADRGVLQQPVAGGPVATQAAGLSATWGGIPIVASASLAATFAYLATRRALDVRVTEPVQLTANAIGALNVELAVVGLGMFDTDYPAEILEIAPTIALAEAATARK